MKCYVLLIIVEEMLPFNFVYKILEYHNRIIFDYTNMFEWKKKFNKVSDELYTMYTMYCA